MQPTRFFDQVLPHLIVRNFDDFLELDGILCFDVPGVGQWSLEFGASEEPVKRGLNPKAGLILRFTQQALTQFLEGSLNIENAMATRAVTARGSAFELLVQFALLVSPPKTDLGWDVKTTG